VSTKDISEAYLDVR